MKKHLQFICGAATLIVAAALGMGGCNLVGGSSGADSITVARALFEDSSTVVTCEVTQQLLVDYPVATDKSIVADSIRAWLHETLKTSCYPQLEEGAKPDKDFDGNMSDVEGMARYYGELGMKQMLDEVKSDIGDDGEEAWIPFGYSNDLEATLLTQTPAYVTYNTGYSIFTGGAHGLYIVGQETFRKSDGHRMGWELVDTLAARPLLDEMIKDGLTEYFEAGDDSPIDNLMEWLMLWDNPDTPDVDESQVIPLPYTPPALTKEGVSFVYQQYEIAAYAAGLPSFVIPYAKAADILTPAAKELLGM